ncbi:MAG TPA: hypothetical protein IAC15_02325 [Candidatus Onthomonas avicola]|nr:hypothetical protein [Candidatus Onthomonas avicola]
MNRHLLPWKQDEEDDFEPDEEGNRKIAIVLSLIALTAPLIALLESCCRGWSAIP